MSSEATTPVGEWIEWHGGENPAGDALVEIRLRNGCTTTETASGFPWDHDEIMPYADIIAYRLVSAPAVVGEGEVRDAVHAWLREDATLAAQMTMTPSIVGKLVDRLAAIRSPE